MAKKNAFAVFLLLLPLLPTDLLAAKKQRSWTAGTVEATAEEREPEGSFSSGPYGPPATLKVYNTWVGYVISSDKMIYMVRYLVRRSGRPNVTVHGPTRIEAEGTKLYLLDEGGKEFEMVIMEKRLPDPKPTQPPEK